MLLRRGPISARSSPRTSGRVRCFLLAAALVISGSATAQTAAGKPKLKVSHNNSARAAAFNATAGKVPDGSSATDSAAAKKGKPDRTAYDYTLPGSDGTSIPVARYKGKVLFVVNLAHASSYNVQLTALQKLSERYKDQGLVILGVPSNDFGACEPGTDEEIRKLYASAGITFPVMQRSALTGVEELPFYTFLTKSEKGSEPVHWNFTKFIVDRKGAVAVRFDPDVAPDSPELISTIERVLNGTYTPHQEKPPAEGGDAVDDDDD